MERLKFEARAKRADGRGWKLLDEAPEAPPLPGRAVAERAMVALLPQRVIPRVTQDR
jgi:hypothetical protein